MTTMLSTRPLCACGQPLTTTAAPMCQDCFRCDGRNHWVKVTGKGNVRITSCIDTRCSFELVD